MAAQIAIEGQEVLVFEKKIHGYLAAHGWSLEDIGISLMYFEETHGKPAVEAMRRFVEKFEAEHPEERSLITATLGHDLNGARDALMRPRTSSY